MYTKENVLKALSHVKYPGKGKSIVELGMILDNAITIDGNNIHLTVTFEKAKDPFQKSLVKTIEVTIKQHLGSGVNIQGNVTCNTPIIEKVTEEKPLSKVKHIIAVASGKGGVGKSTVSSNLAIALAAQGKKVGLLDADVFGPSVPTMFDTVDVKPVAEDVNGKAIITPVEKYGVKLLSIGYFVDPKDALIWRGGMASGAIKQLITDADWGELDYFVIDFPPGTSDIHLTLLQTIDITASIIVTTPQEVALADARKGINMFQNDKFAVPIWGIVENMAWFTPAELPDNKYYIFGKDGGKNLADQFGVPLLGQIPLVQSIREGGDLGKPVATDETSITGMAFRDLAQNIINR